MRRPFLSLCGFGLCVGLLMAVSGCASTKTTSKIPEEGLKTTLMVARAGEQVKLSWESEPGFLYTVMCSDRLGGRANWRMLPKYQNLRGTGGMLEAEDLAPAGTPRYYRLHIVPVQ